MSESDCSGRRRRAAGAAAWSSTRRSVRVRRRRGARPRGRGVRRRPPHLRRARRAGDPARARRSRAAGVGAGDHVGLYLRNSVEHLEAMLACYKARAVPINVNYRYVADELATCSPTPTSSRSFHDADTRRARRRGRARPDVRLVRRSSAIRRVRASSCGRVGRARPRAALPRRPLRALHRRHDRHAEGCACGARRTSSSAALGGGNPGGPPITAPERDRGVGARQPRATAAAVPARGRRRARRSSCRSRSVR